MRRVILAAAPLLAVAALVSAAGARQTFSPTAVQHRLEIRFEPVGCHSWSLDGGAFAADRTLRLRTGQSLVVVNHDVCPQTLVQTAGNPVAIRNLAPAAVPRHVQVVGVREPEPVVSLRLLEAREPGEMTAMGDRTEVTFYEPGAYVLVTHEGETTLPGDWSTVGPDNQLVLHVQVDAGRQVPD
jgi:hypothetical protein